MLWLVPAWIASILVAYLLGYCIRGLTKRIAELEHVLQSKVDKKPVKEEPTSTLIDPLDEVQNMLYEHAKQQKELNPDE